MVNVNAFMYFINFKMVILNRIFVDLKALLMLVLLFILSIWTAAMGLIAFVIASFIMVGKISVVFSQMYIDAVLGYIETKLNVKK